MPESSSAIPAWTWLVAAALVIGIAFTGYRVGQIQRHLAIAQSELESASQAAETASAARTALQTKL